MKVSIIIRCFNEFKHIGKLLKGIQLQDYSNTEVIVVDSGSTDGTLNVVKSYDVILVKIRPDDFSFGYALNMGCAKATGDILLMASAHVYPVYPNWVAQIAELFASDSKIAVVYGRQIGDTTTKYSEIQLFKKWFPEESDFDQVTPFCNNANCAVRRVLWEGQMYDETLTGLEDLDWAKKIKEKGYKIAYQANATIVHIHEESFDKVRNRYKREAIALKNIMPDIKFTFYDFIRSSITNIISDYWNALSSGEFLKNIISIPLFRLNQFYGTYLGYRLTGKITDDLKRRFYYSNGLKKRNFNEPQIDPIDYGN